MNQSQINMQISLDKSNVGNQAKDVWLVWVNSLGYGHNSSPGSAFGYNFVNLAQEVNSRQAGHLPKEGGAYARTVPS